MSRCPFCHASVDAGERWLACAGCLARHHAECWNAHGACATCAARVSLEPRDGAWARARGLALAGAALVLGVALGLAASFAGGNGGVNPGESVQPLAYHPVEELIERARGEQSHGQLASALGLLDRAVAEDPTSERARRCRALVLEERHEPARAVADLTRAIELDARSAKAWALRGWLRATELGDPAGGVHDLARAVALDPGDTWAADQLTRARGQLVGPVH